MDYKVVVTRDAEEDLERFIKCLIFEKKSLQAAENVHNIKCDNRKSKTCGRKFKTV